MRSGLLVDPLVGEVSDRRKTGCSRRDGDAFPGPAGHLRYEFNGA
jgi:hypothetical protein